MKVFAEFGDITPLAGSATGMTEWHPVGETSRLRTLFYSDVAAAALGVKLQQSEDRSTVHWETPASTVATGVGFAAAFDVSTVCQFARLVVVNGATPQTKNLTVLRGIE